MKDCYWVKTCWESDFLEVAGLPADCEDFMAETECLKEQLRSLEGNLSAWLRKSFNNEEDEGMWFCVDKSNYIINVYLCDPIRFWSIIVTQDVPHRCLVAVLAYLIQTGAKMCASFVERSSAILAASVYIRLFVLPGSAAFKIYNPELFLQCCRFLTKGSPADAVGGKETRKTSPSLSQGTQQSQKKGRRKGRANAKTDMSNSDLMECDEDGDADEEQATLTSSEIRQLSLLNKNLLQDVLLVCERYTLRQSESTAVQLLAVLVDFIKTHYDGITEKMGQWMGSNCSMGMLGYKAIHLLCQPFHGHVSAMISQVFRRLLNHILMMEDGKTYSSLGRPALVVRQQGLDFVRFISEHIGERCVPSLKTLIQHVSFKVPDKLEYRSHAAQAVFELLSCLPDLEYAKMLEWLKQLSKNQRIGQRSFVVDLMALLLEKPERSLSGDVPTELTQFATHQSMVCVLLNRCSDSNAGVRSRALVSFSSCTKSKYSAVVETMRGVITPVTSDPQRKPRRFMPTPWVGAQQGADSLSTFAVEGSDDSNLPSKSREATAGGSETPGGAAGTASIHTPVAGAVSFGNILLTPGFDPCMFFFVSDNVFPSSVSEDLPDAEGVVSMIHRRVLDSKVVVRKCALQALESFILFEAPNFRSEDLGLLQERCADPALSVRKQAVQSLFELLEAWPRHKEVQRAWVFGTLPRVLDTETSVQERCFDLLEEVILLKLKPNKSDRASSESNEWDLLNLITQESSEKLRRYLQKACQFWARNKKIKPAVVSAVQTHISGPNDTAAWMFLAELSKTSVKIDHRFIMQYWKQNASSLTDLSQDDSGKWSNILSVLGTAAKSMQDEEVKDLQDDLQIRLNEFSYPPFVIAGMVSCVSKLYSRTTLGTPQHQQPVWGEHLLAVCVKYLSDIIFKTESFSDSQLDEQQLIKYVFTLGEVCQRCPTKIPKKAVLLVQSIVAAPCISALSQTEHTDQVQASQKPASAASSEPAPELQESSENSEASSQVSSQPITQTLSQFRGSKMSSTLRAHGFITLGKLCLVDESLSKKIIPALARELEVCDSPAVRNNVVVIMGDLTVRYTTVVDRYATNIAACLKDPSALIRKNTLTILTRLLQEEYVKWKGVLFFRYITTLLDEVEEIRTLAQFCMEHLLLKKHPNMFFNPFVECIFHFNNYQDHTTYNKFKQTDREKSMFTLEGKAHASQRMQMYTFMLENMTDEQRFKVAAKLNKEILAAVVDKIIPLNKEGSALLQDTLAVLSCKEIKLTSLRGRGFGGQDEEVDGPLEAQAQAQAVVGAVAKKAFISQVVRRNVIENIVPVVISLKHMFEQARSSLLRDLMVYLRELMKDYKNEVK
ncbi:condensin-2 complex subunit D3-like, partial [Elysia marginata]